MKINCITSFQMTENTDIETKSSIILQRAFRRWRAHWDETLNILIWGIMYTRERAATILQRWWRHAYINKDCSDSGNQINKNR